MISRLKRFSVLGSLIASGTFADNDTRDHGCQGVHVSVKIAFQLARIKVFYKFFDFSIGSSAVAHKASIL